MTIDIQHLRSQLQALLDGSISSINLNKIVQFSRSLCEAHLNHFRPSVAMLVVKQGITITDLAYDCIAEAFARDERGAYPLINNFVGSLRGSLEDLPDQEIFLAFKSFLTRISDAQLARLYAQNDPIGSKIHRNIRDCLRHSSIFKLERDFRGYVLRPSQVESLDHVERFPQDDIERSFLQSARKHHRIPDLLQILHDIVTKQARYRRSIPLVDVVQLAKKVYEHEVGLDAYEDQGFSLDGLTDFEIQQIRSQVEVELKEKVLLTYFFRGKVDRQQAEAMFTALRDMLSDWCSGESPQRTIYEYLRRSLEISEGAYELQLRIKMEYLVKIAREQFAARLMKDI